MIEPVKCHHRFALTHDLRHCTASYLAMNGGTLVEIADILGHRTLSMVKRYTHIADSHSAVVVLL